MAEGWIAGGWKNHRAGNTLFHESILLIATAVSLLLRNIASGEGADLFTALSATLERGKFPVTTLWLFPGGYARHSL
ncbi:MAG: hypothetical protein ACOYM2_03855, partial [Rectinemataceae bacterium]